MSIVRVEHSKDRPYLVVAKTTVLDAELTLAQRGFLLALLTLPDSWALNIRDVSRRFGLNKSTAGKYLSALSGAGYCRIAKSRTARGTYEADYTVYEEPVRKNRTGSLYGSTGTVKPDVLSIDRPSKEGGKKEEHALASERVGRSEPALGSFPPDSFSKPREEAKRASA